MNLTQFLSILRARWWVALLVFVLTVGTTLLVSLCCRSSTWRRRPWSSTSSPIPSPAMLRRHGSRRRTWPRRSTSSRATAWRNAWCATSSWPRTRRCAQQWVDATGGEGSIEVVAGEPLPEGHGCQAFARKQCHLLCRTSAPDPRFAAGLGERLRAGLHRYRARTEVDPAKQYSNFFDKRAKEARDALRAGAGQGVGVPEEERHHRHRRASRHRERAPERAVVPARGDAGAGRPSPAAGRRKPEGHRPTACRRC